MPECGRTGILAFSHAFPPAGIKEETPKGAESLLLKGVNHPKVHQMVCSATHSWGNFTGFIAIGNHLAILVFSYPGLRWSPFFPQSTKKQPNTPKGPETNKKGTLCLGRFPREPPPFNSSKRKQFCWRSGVTGATGATEPSGQGAWSKFARELGSRLNWPAFGGLDAWIPRPNLKGEWTALKGRSDT